MRRLWKRLFQYLFPAQAPAEFKIEPINRRRAELAGLSDEDLNAAGRLATTLVEVIAVTAVAAARLLGLEMFDVQLQGALNSRQVIEQAKGVLIARQGISARAAYEQLRAQARAERRKLVFDCNRHIGRGCCRRLSRRCSAGRPGAGDEEERGGTSNLWNRRRHLPRDRSRLLRSRVQFEALSPPAAARRQKRDKKQHDEQEAKASARVIAPPSRVRPSGNRSDDHENEEQK